MGAKRIEERFAYSGGKVDRTGARPVIRDVLLCGPTSINKRRYKAEAFAGDRVKKYDGRPVYLNHGNGRDGRSYEQRIGKVINPRHRADGMPVGDIEVRPKHPYAEALLDDCENDHRSLGMSHVAMCGTALARDGWDEVNVLEEVESVDVVLDPATTKGMFHSEGTTVKISLKAFVERFGPKWGAKKWAAATKLCEDMGPMMDAPVMDAPADDVAEGDLKTGLIAALMPVVEEAFESGNSDKAVSALKDFIKLHAKHTGKAADDTPAPETEESKKTVSLAGVLKECTDAQYTPDTASLVALAEVPTAPGRAALIATLKKASEAAPARPESAGRGRIEAGAGKPAAGTAPVAEGKPPTDAKAFAEFVK